MITTTSLNHPKIQWDIEAAMWECVRKSAKPGCQIGWTIIENKEGKEVIRVRHVRSPLGVSFFSFYDNEYNDIKDVVLKSIRNNWSV